MIHNDQRISSNKCTSPRVSRKYRVARLPALLVLTISATSFAANHLTDHTQAHAIPYLPPVTRLHRLLQIGRASWYGHKFQGRKTATGETFDMNEMTCAHPSLPLGSWLRITNLRNHRSVVVRVNDRGPYFGSRIVDLSYGAARAVGMNGVAQVKIETTPEPLFDGPRPLIAGLRMPPSLENLSLLLTPLPAR